MKKSKSNKTASECHEEFSGNGQRAKALRNLAIEKSKIVTEKKIFVSSIKLFPKRVPILIEVLASSTELERLVIITKRMTRSEHDATFRNLECV